MTARDYGEAILLHDMQQRTRHRFIRFIPKRKDYQSSRIIKIGGSISISCFMKPHNWTRFESKMHHEHSRPLPLGAYNSVTASDVFILRWTIGNALLSNDRYFRHSSDLLTG